MVVQIVGLHKDLQDHLVPSTIYGPDAVILHHPLVVETFPLNTMPPDMIELINKRYTLRAATKAQALLSKNWGSFVFMHERPYRIEALIEAQGSGLCDDPKTHWSLVGDVWTDSENICQFMDEWKEIWDCGVEKRHLVMSADERKALKAMPTFIDVWRGVGFKSSVNGMSWTVDRGKAIWFANRYSADKNRTPMLVSGRVQKSDVIAHFMGRNESEIVVNPDDVEILDIQTLS